MEETTRRLLSYYRHTLGDAARQNPDISGLTDLQKVQKGREGGNGREGDKGDKAKVLLGNEGALVTGRLTDNLDLLGEFFAAAKGGDKKEGAPGNPEGEGGPEGALEGVFCPWI